MKTPVPAVAMGSQAVLDIRCPEHVAMMGEAYSRERQTVLDALRQLEGMGYADSRQREKTILATMEPLPGHALMDRAPREVLKLRAALFLVSCHEGRRN